MTRRHAPVAPLPALVLVLGAVSAAAAPEEPARKPGLIQVTVVRALGSGRREGLEECAVAKELAAYRSRLAALHSRHARFDHEGTVERTAAPGERITVTFGAGGKLAIASEVGPEPERLRLRIEETLPNAKEPCMRTALDVAPGVPAAVFCDEPGGTTTHVFLVAARPAR